MVQVYKGNNDENGYKTSPEKQRDTGAKSVKQEKGKKRREGFDGRVSCGNRLCAEAASAFEKEEAQNRDVQIERNRCMTGWAPACREKDRFPSRNSENADI